MVNISNDPAFITEYMWKHGIQRYKWKLISRVGGICGRRSCGGWTKRTGQVRKHRTSALKWNRWTTGAVSGNVTAVYVAVSSSELKFSETKSVMGAKWSSRDGWCPMAHSSSRVPTVGKASICSAIHDHPIRLRIVDMSGLIRSAMNSVSLDLQTLVNLINEHTHHLLRPC